MLKMTQRIERRSLPKVSIIDMRQEMIDVKGSRIFSRALEHAIAQVP
jgi:primosomal protein N'